MTPPESDAVEAGADEWGLYNVDMAVQAVVSELRSMAIPVEDRERVARVAALSAHEEPIAELLADALDKWPGDEATDVDAVLDVDRRAREVATALVAARS